MQSNNPDNLIFQKTAPSPSVVSDTPSRIEKISQKAKNDYLEIVDPKPSTSKARVSPPVFKVPKPKPKESKNSDDSRIDENSSSDSEEDRKSTTSTASSSNRRPYSHKEEQKIVKWIAKHRRYSEVNGIAMWRLMAESGELGDRSYQSLKERFRKHIIGKINIYDLSEAEKEAFKKLNAKKKIRRVKNGRP